MADHVVRQGECIASIAYANGLFWQTIWDDDANTELRQLRGNPYVLMAGDRVHVPDRRVKSEEADTGATHTFRRRGVPEKLKLRIMHEGKPRANEAYRFTMDGVVTEGTTDAEGNVEQFLMPDAESGTLQFSASQYGPEVEYTLAFKQLDPVSVPSGQQARLRNLGLYSGEVDGISNDALRDALRTFQQLNGLTVSGEADETTAQALVTAHGS